MSLFGNLLTTYEMIQGRLVRLLIVQRKMVTLTLRRGR